MSGVDATVLFAGEEQRGGISHAVGDVMVGGIGIKCRELSRIFDGSKFGSVENAVRIEFHAEHVVDADVRDDHLKKFGMLREGGSHEEATVAGAFDGELFATSIIRTNQEPGASDEVIENILLVGEIAGSVPFLAVLAAAAQVCHGDDSSLIQPDAPGKIELRRKAYPVPTVASQNGWTLAVQARAPFANDIQWDESAVFGFCEFAESKDGALVPL